MENYNCVLNEIKLQVFDFKILTHKNLCMNVRNEFNFYKLNF